MEQTRSEYYKLLLEHFDPRTIDSNARPETHRYVAVAEEFFDERRVGALVALCTTKEEAFGVLADSVLDGYAPDGVYDLDTREKIEIHVSTPIVTPAQDQGITYNPLKDA